MPRDATYEYCYCSTCKLKPEGRSLEQQQTIVKHEQADKRRSERATGEEPDQLASDHEDIPLLEYHSHALRDDDLNDIFDQSNHDHDHSLESADASYDPADFSLTESDPDMEHIMLQFDELRFSDSEAEVEEEGEENDLLDDPLFQSRGMLFTGEDSGSEDDNKDEDDDLPAAFQEHPAIRNAYIRAFLLASLKGSTHAAVQIHLEGIAVGLRAAEAQSPDVSFDGLDRMARTLATAEKRLGISTDKFITYYFICDICWTLHHPSELTQLLDPACNKPGCSGTLYTSKRLSDGTTKRTPTKILPYVPLKKAIQHLLLRPGKYEQLQQWRGDGDKPGRVQPLMARGLDAFPDPSKHMSDVYDGWGWRAIQAGLERRRGGAWTIQDVDVRNLHQRFVALPLGLVWQMNLDWYVRV
jgi:hypothetical protein